MAMPPGCSYQSTDCDRSDRGAPAVRPHRRAERVLRQRVLDVGQQQFLVLLLVRDAQFDQIGAGRIVDQPLHRLVDMGAPADHFAQRRPRQHAAAAAQDALALGLVIGIEQEGPVLVVEAIAAAGGRAAGRFPRTRWCARDATWPGSHLPSTGSSRRLRSAARPAPRTRRGWRASARRVQRSRERSVRTVASGMVPPAVGSPVPYWTFAKSI